jgi:hypothetical protein
MNIYTIGVLFKPWKEGNPVLCENTDEPGAH